MRRIALVASLAALAGCAHPEDRRWDRIAAPPSELKSDWKPLVSAYSFATPPEPPAATRLKDLSGEGQAAYIAELSRAKDPAALRLSLAAPIVADAGLAPTTALTLDRTLVIDVQRPHDAALGDRIVRSEITIEPADSGYEFASYSVVATDNQVQNIAHLETKTEGSLAATLSPTIKGFGDNSIAATGSASHTTTADITAQYEKLNVQIVPDRMVVTRESERGLDVIGNTIIRLKLALVPPPDLPGANSLFLAVGQTLFTGDGPLRSAKASLDFVDYPAPQQCALRAKVTMKYLIRRVTAGSRYYTEGKQTARYDVGAVTPKDPPVLVRAAETAPALWQITFGPHGGGLAIARPGADAQPLVFNNYDAAQSFAGWLRATGSRTLSKGVRLIGGRRPLSAAVVARYRNDCVPVTQSP